MNLGVFLIKKKKKIIIKLHIINDLCKEVKKIKIFTERVWNLITHISLPLKYNIVLTISVLKSTDTLKLT